MNDLAPIPAILGIGTAVPQHRIEQAEAGERLAKALQGDTAGARFARRIFRNCGVSVRYTCEPNLLEDAPLCRYIPGAEDRASAPATEERMSVYRRESVPLALQAARLALTDSGVEAHRITHLITVSCTGQYMPGLDSELTHRLGLSPRVNRIPLTFTGCAAGLKAVSLGRQIMTGYNQAMVLVVCVELCTLHIQPGGTREDIFAASFFGDGASACVIGPATAASTDTPDHEQDIILLHDDYTELLAASSEAMTWRVGDYGFELYLSPDIPSLIGEALRERLDRYTDVSQLEYWAVHPGGKKIIDTVQDLFGLPERAVESSRRVLRHYGNLSSATILYVLSDMRQEIRMRGKPSAQGIAMAFGPGLTLEMLKVTFRCVRSSFEIERQRELCSEDYAFGLQDRN